MSVPPSRSTSASPPLRAAGIDPSQRFGWRHPLPRRGPVDRLDALIDAARGKRVVHVGFVDELFERKLKEGVWLHGRLAEIAESVVGLDSSEEGVRRAGQLGFAGRVVDAQSPEAVAALSLEPADVVIAGEIVEHLDSPGPFLRAMRLLVRPHGVLLLTTPNAYRALNFVAPLTGSELVHPDHTAWHSPQTLRSLLERNGWLVEEIAYYRTPRRHASSFSGHAANAARSLLATLSRIRPYWSDGLIVWARPAP